MRPHSSVARRLLAPSQRWNSTVAIPKVKAGKPGTYTRGPLIPDGAEGSGQPPLSDELGDRRLRTLSRTTKNNKSGGGRALEKTQKRIERPRIEYNVGDNGPSLERQQWFAGVEESGTVEVAEDEPGLEVGRVVESRRNKYGQLGLIIGSIFVSGKRRLLLFRANGEIWPIALTDVAFVMPSSLVPPQLAKACWSPELLQMWADGKDIGISPSGAEESIIGSEEAAEMFAKRREVATLLRRVQRESERMMTRLSSGSVATGGGGSIEAAWEHFVPSADSNARERVTATQVAEFLLNSSSIEPENRIQVRPHTLPAFAAHLLLMSRPDLFVTGEDEPWQPDAHFLIRSRSERERIVRVTHAVENNTEMLSSFIVKASKVRDALKNGDKKIPSWSQDDLDIIWILFLPIAETRSYQARVPVPLAAAIVKAYEQYNNLENSATSEVAVPLLTDIGMCSPEDSLRTSLIQETISRSKTLGGISPAVTPTDLAVPTPADVAMDSIRQEFSHRVFVIDSESAQELDDGVAVERIGNDQFWIHVHIADPTRYLDRNDEVTLAASYSGSTTYLPEGTIPLLPPSLGGGTLSLGESDRSQSVMTFSARVDKEGNIHDYKVAMGQLKSAVLTTYNKVNDVLGIKAIPSTHPLGHAPRDLLLSSSPRKYPELTASDISDLELLRDLASAIRTKRFSTAGIDYASPTGVITPLSAQRPAQRPMFNAFDRASLPSTPTAYPPRMLDFAVHHRSPAMSAENTVAELAVLANRVAAKFCDDRGLCVAFRGGSPLRETTRTPAHLTVDKLLARRKDGMVDSYERLAANLVIDLPAISFTPVRNWLMGLDKEGQSYVRATSPLRRFDDILAHWQIKAALAAEANISGAHKPFTEEEMATLIRRTSFAQKHLSTIETAASRFWYVTLILDRATGPLPKGYSAEGMVDLRNLQGKIVGPVQHHPTGTRTPVMIESLGMTADFNYSPTLMPDAGMVIGATVNLQMDPTTIRAWPNPIVNTIMTSPEIIPPPPI